MSLKFVPAFQFIEIQLSNLPAVKRLLFQRNQTLPEYVDWKYGGDSPSGFRGVVAYDGKEEAGCFGSVPFKVRFESGEIVESGWFADWYVRPEYRGCGLGRALLDQLASETKFYLGHPGPRQALGICLTTGWQPMAFQAKLRWVLQGWPYYRRRTHHPAKALAQWLFASLQQRYERLIKNRFHPHSPTSVSRIELILSDESRQWLQAQPIDLKVRRTFGDYHHSEVNIYFADFEMTKTGEISRRITWIDPLSQLSIKALHKFVASSQADGITFVEMLTGSRELSQLCTRIGASQVIESPIVCHGYPPGMLIPGLQGIHRENWLFRASQA